MRAVLELGGALVGILLVARGVLLATGRARPRDLGGMLLAAAGLGLAVVMITAASSALGR